MPRPPAENYVDACPHCKGPDTGVRRELEINPRAGDRPGWRIMPHGVPRCLGSGFVVASSDVRNRTEERRKARLSN